MLLASCCLFVPATMYAWRKVSWSWFMQDWVSAAVTQKTLCTMCLPPIITYSLTLRTMKRKNWSVGSKCLSPFAAIAVVAEKPMIATAESLSAGTLHSWLQLTVVFKRLTVVVAWRMLPLWFLLSELVFVLLACGWTLSIWGRWSCTIERRHWFE